MMRHPWTRWRSFTTVGVIVSLAISVAAVQAADAPTSQRTRPNILFILSDQFRYDCLGATGNTRIHTPNIDRLAREGVLFDRAYAAQPVCSPNRSSIISGLYPHSSGVWENCSQEWVDKVGLPKRVRTLSEIITPAGYDCGYFGKWHLGRRDAFATFPEYPSDGRGDDHYFGKGESRRYAVDVITQDAITFLKQKRTRPFYVYVSFYPPHPPYSVPPRYLERYQNLTDAHQRAYYAMCTKVDEKVGELLASLDELGVAGDTLVVFSSDHGHNFQPRWNNHDKRLCYDTASRVPLVMRMPGVIPAGRRTQGLISSVDLVPTMLDLIGQPEPEGLQGQDLADLARGKTDRGRDYVFIENIPYPFKREKGEERCVFDGQWKLILSTHRPPELYDIMTDAAETENRWEAMKGSPLAARLMSALAQWARQTGDELTPRLLGSVWPRHTEPGNP